VNFSRALATFETRRNTLLDTLSALPAEELTAHPVANKWSILEHVEHIIRAERVIFDGVATPDQLTARPRSIASRIRSVIVHGVLRFDIPVEAPSKKMLPTGTRTLEELRALWDENAGWLATYAARIGARGDDLAVFWHSVIGPMTFAQSLRLRRAHLDRHMRQIRYLQTLQR
jgi:hypothetical protein